MSFLLGAVGVKRHITLNPYISDIKFYSRIFLLYLFYKINNYEYTKGNGF